MNILNIYLTVQEDRGDGTLYRLQCIVYTLNCTSRISRRYIVQLTGHILNIYYSVQEERGDGTLYSLQCIVYTFSCTGRDSRRYIVQLTGHILYITLYRRIEGTVHCTVYSSYFIY